MKKNIFVIFLFIVFFLFTATPVLAKGAHFAQSTVVNPAGFVAFWVTITAFFKKRLNLTGDNVLLLAFVVGAALFFLPDIENAIPQSAGYIEKFIEFLKLFLASAGSFDFVVNTGTKIASNSSKIKNTGTAN